jgi:hypothetical protein
MKGTADHVGSSKVKNGRTLKLTLDELKPDTLPRRSYFGPVISFDVPVLTEGPLVICSEVNLTIEFGRFP